MDPRGFHLVDLVIHLLNGILLFFFSRLLIRHTYKPENRNPSHAWIPAIVAAIFLLHPIQTQAVNYASQRMAQMVVFFNLLALISYLRFRSGPFPGIKSLAWLVAFSVSCVLALLSKGNAATIPLQLLALEVFILSLTDHNKRWIIGWSSLVAIGILMAAFIVPLPVDDIRITRLDYLLTQPWVVLNYLRLLIIPWPLSFDHPVPLWSEMGIAVTVASVFAHLAFLALTLFWARKQPLLAFGIWFIYLSLSIESSIIPLRDLMVEHRLYLPIIGFALIVADLLSSLKLKQFAVVSALLAVMMSWGTWQRNQVWKSEWSLWQSALDTYPRSYYALTQQANALLDRGDSALATQYLDSALAIEPTSATALNSRALIYIEEGNYYDALQCFDQIYQLEPSYWPALLNHGYMEERLNQPSEAAKRYQMAVARCKGCGEPHLFLGTLFLNENKFAQADKHFQLAAEKGYSSARLFNNHGYLKLLMNDTSQAVALFEQSLALRPNYVNPMMSLGKIYLSRKDTLTAQLHFINILSTEPANHEAREFVLLIDPSERP